MNVGRRRKRTNTNGRGFQNSFRQSGRLRLPWRGGCRTLAFLIAISVACVSLLYAARDHRASRTAPVRKTAPKTSAKKFQLPADWPAPRFENIQNGKYTEERERHHLVYTVDPALQVRRIVKMLRAVVPPERRREVRAETLEKHIAELVQVSTALAQARAAASVLKQIGL